MTEHERARRAHGALFAPYEEVAAVFPKTKRFSGKDEDRGVYPTGKQPHYGPESKSYTGVPVLEGYEQFTTFSPEESPYIRAVRQALNTAFAGKILRLNDGKMTVENIPSIKDRIIALAFQKMAPPQRQGVQFGNVIAEASLGVLTDFRRAYPNLMPALRYFFEVAGAEGIQAASSNASKALYVALEAEKRGEDPKAAIAAIGNINDHFYNRRGEDHTRIVLEDKITPAAKENRCEDKELADDIVGAAKQAASILVDNYLFWKQYKDIATDYEARGSSMWGFPDTPPNIVKSELTNMVRRHVEGLANAVDMEMYVRRTAARLTGPLKSLIGK